MILRLLTYNVRSLRDDGAAVTRVIRDTAPDVVCVQEAPRFLRWRSKCASLARRSGMVIVTGGRPAASNLLMCTLGIDVLETHDVLFTRDQSLHQRGMALATLQKAGRAFAVAGTHLDLVDAPRLRHVGELQEQLRHRLTDDRPVMIAGDVNETPDGPAWRALTDLGVDAFAAVGDGDGYTYSSREAVRRIDGVFVAKPLLVTAARVIDSADAALASDHRPVLVEVDLDA